jgi:ABC-type molybdenum transport system ATPase subunit/photorepair protein PhrA
MAPAIRSALFDGDEIDAVDLRELSVTWFRGGLRLMRPFSAFSSGEQAFAYARARIEQIQPQGTEHVLLVLDEFSAFIAGDRRRLLYRVLEEQIEEGAVSQVVFIVPLAQDYVQAAEEAGSAVSPRLKARAEQVNKHGYFAEEVSV